MKRVVYNAIFEQGETGGYGVFFPDLPGCVSVGKTYDLALKNAAEGLALHIWGMTQDGDEIPVPSSPPYPECDSNCTVSPVVAYPDLVAESMRNQAVRVNVSIPAWLRAAAEKASLNYSKILQAALMERLDIAHE